MDLNNIGQLAIIQRRGTLNLTLQQIEKNPKKQKQPEPTMSSYQIIASAFNKIGLDTNSLATESQITHALNTLAQNSGLMQYDRNVAEELWNQTPKESGNRVYVRDFVETVVKGESLVRSSIQDLQQQVQHKTDPVERDELLQDIASYTEDLKFLTVPFGLRPGRQSEVLAASKYSTPANNQSRYSGHSTVIFSKQIPQKQSGSSTDLKFAFALTCLLTFIQIILMFHKHHFYSLLTYLSIFAIFFLGYFDLHYMRFVKINLLVSTVLDLVWLVVSFGEYWSPVAETQHSSLQWGYLKFVLFFVLALAFFKIVLAAVLFKYRNNPAQMRKSVSLCGQKYNLNAAPLSPIAKIMGEQHRSSEGGFNASGNYENFHNNY